MIATRHSSVAFAGLRLRIQTIGRLYSTTYSKAISTTTPNAADSLSGSSTAFGPNRSGPVFAAVLTEITNQAPNVKTFSFTAQYPVNTSDSSEFTYKPGQWVEVSMPSRSPTTPKTQFSISSAPSPSSQTFKITVKDAYQNPIVKHLHSPQLRTGDLMYAQVGGSFYYKAPSPPPAVEKILMVAGGVGVAPLIAMLEHLVNESTSSETRRRRNVTLIYSVRDEKELLFSERLEELCQTYVNGKDGLNVDVQCYVTRYALKEEEGKEVEVAKKSDLNRAGIKFYYGTYISSRLLSDYLSQSDANMDDTVVYMCGPESLERAVHGYLKQLEFPLQQLHFEKWWK
ncbi:ferredoxin reductase-like protein [Rhizoclosmatium globosum]|uniref:Ferredoxin reductase-like protein n=1 Tax=Rhizoclosmatium globosum TaxID=329046 RepID=A0A1Y2D2M8_9FUNG|nr:ferredoxin reductase-like protein [Rhizoclosmatium globosum]|eukprot:ORY53549.1 ferredoxin reductase-like protein [Rhizoclosmatium globosum]